MHGHAHDFGERRDLIVQTVRQTEDPARGESHVLLHEPIDPTARKRARPQVVLADDVICLDCRIGQHDHPLSAAETTRAVSHYLADAFVNQGHRQFLGKHLWIAKPPIIALVRIANGQIGGPHDHFGLIQIDLGFHGLEQARGRESIYPVKHR